MSGFRCPFCGQIMAVTNGTYESFPFNFGGPFGPSSEGYGLPHANVHMYKCPNDECNEITLFISSFSGFVGNEDILVHPRAIYRSFPAYVPEAIRADYEEASLILNQSPKAAATLARRCLQGMIRDFWQVSGKANLRQEIEAIRDKVPPAQWKSIDAIRRIGNIGAHMEKDVNLIIDVEPKEAKALLKLIELLIENWYIARHDEEDLYNSITAIGDAKDAAKGP